MCIRVPLRCLVKPIVAGCLTLSGSAFGQSIVVDEAQVSLIQNTLVAAPISGVVAKVKVTEGDQVTEGQVLAQFDREQAETEVVAAEAAYEAARIESNNDVDARYAKRTLEVRQRELQQSLEANEAFAGSVSKTEIEKLTLVVDQSRLAIEQAQQQQSVAKAKAAEKKAAVRIAAASLAKHTLHATVSGLAVEVAVEPGEWVEAGKPVVRLISLDPIRVECFVDPAKVGSGWVGRTVEFVPVIPSKDPPTEEKPLKGKVSFVSPELNPVTGQVRLWATIDNPDQQARAGMRGRLVIAAE